MSQGVRLSGIHLPSSLLEGKDRILKGFIMKRNLSVSFFLCVLCVLSGAAHAQSLPFATISPRQSGPTYQFDNDSLTFGLVSSSVEVTFKFYEPVPVIGTNPIPARLIMSADAAGPVSLGPPSQQLLISFAFVIVPVNPEDIFGEGILLRGSALVAFLDQLDPSTGNLYSGSEVGLQMTSSYVNFDSPDDHTALWSFGDTTPDLFEAGPNGSLIDMLFAGTALFTASVTAIPPGPISGKVVFEDIASNAVSQIVTFRFRPVSGGAAITREENIPADGAFAISNIPSGHYELSVKSPRYLRSNIVFDSTTNPANNLMIFLPAGDANDDNIVDIDDLAALIEAFDADPSSPNWNGGVADFNGDNLVSVDDLSLLIRNFDRQGDD
jgi:hypothetical protein